jgi:hypothetical protein
MPLGSGKLCIHRNIDLKIKKKQMPVTYLLLVWLSKHKEDILLHSIHKKSVLI